MASSTALKLAGACLVLLLCVASGLARPALASSPPSVDEHQEQAAAGELRLRELVDHDLGEELVLLAQRGGGGGGGSVGDICPRACQTCLITCAVTCVLNQQPIACFANCTVSSSCFGKSVAVAPLPAVPA